MIGYIILGLLAIALAFVLFSPALKGFRTQIFGYLTVALGSVLPLLSQVTDYLQTLDWRQYVLSADRKNIIVLGIIAGLGIVAIILRHMTTTPVGKKE